MNPQDKLLEIQNKYDFLFGEGNPETDAIADADTTWLIARVEQLENALEDASTHLPGNYEDCERVRDMLSNAITTGPKPE